MLASLNRVYRLIWSHVNQTWIIVSEKTRGKGKGANRKVIAAAVLTASNLAWAAPMDGQITAGSGTISQSGSTTTVTQTSQNLSLGWGSFNTASHETVNFVQPSSSAIAVNRIYDTNPTQFLGRLNANGQVYLINPNGVLFGAGSQVNVGGLVASTLDISDAALNSATRNFSGVGTGSIINQGSIHTADGGYVAFIGNTVSNQGNINTPKGSVALGAGSDVTLSFSGDSLVKLQINQSTLNNLAENGGLIQADGGAVWLSAGAKDVVLASVVNNTGIIQARSVQEIDGVIVLEAGSAGTASNSGTLNASGLNAGETGGVVKVLGGDVNLAAGSVINVSGDAGGGTALVGGNFLGTGPEQNAKNMTIAAGATINADAITTGNGGKVAVWSDKVTQFHGGITARGGSTSGNGGQVETSGKLLKVGTTASVKTSAAHGTAGDWLLDPDNIVIGSISMLGAGYGIDVDSTVLSNALNNGNVTIKTSRTGSGAGDIIVLDYIGFASSYDSNHNQSIVEWNSNSYTLTLSAYRNIEFGYLPSYFSPGANTTLNVAGGIYATGGHGNVVLRTDNTGTGTGRVIFDDSINNFILLGDAASTVSIYYSPSSYSAPIDYSQNVTNGQLKAYMAINVVGSADSKVYDGKTTANLSGLNTLLTMPDGLTLDKSNAKGVFTDKNVGTDKTVTITNLTVTGASTSTNSDGATVFSYGGKDYYLNGLDSKTASITQKTISVSGVSASNKAYDGTTSATFTGTAAISASDINTNDLGISDDISLTGGVATFASANAGTHVVTATGFTLAGDDKNNYILTQPTGLSATINKADLNLTGNKTYDGTTTVAGSTLVANGVNGETFSVIGAGDASNLSSKNVQGGSMLSSVTGLALGTSSNGGLSSNYNVLSTTGSGYTVTAKALTLGGITALDKVYDTTTAATLNTAGVTYSGLISGDTVALSGTGIGTFDRKNAGDNIGVTVTGYTLSGSEAGNYVVTQPTGLTANISKADLIVSGISGVDKTYNANTTATLSGTASVTGLMGDVVLVGGTGSGTFADANADVNKSITVTGYTLSGTDAGNYNLVQPTNVTATINKADLVLKGNKVYDGSTSVAGSTLVANGVNHETFTVIGAGDSSNLSSKDVQIGSALSSATGLTLGTSSNGGLSSNYNVLSTSGSEYTVTAKGITLSGITAADKTYDATTVATLNTSNVSFSGLISGDTVTLSGTGVGSFLTKDAESNKQVTVTGYTISGGDAGNYFVAQPTNVTANITKADLFLSGLSANDKVYDAGTAAVLTGTASLSAGISGDVVSLSGTGVGNFADKNVGNNKTVTVSGYSLAGSDADNYSIVTAPVSAAITPASITVTGITASDKVFDNSTAAVINTDNAILSGKLGADVVTIASTGAFSDATVGNGKTVNLSSTYGGTDAGNYTFTSQATTLASITAAPQVVNPAPTQEILNTVTQIQSSVLPPQASAQPQVLNLSSTLVVQQTESGDVNAERPQERASAPLLNTTSGFGTPAPTLQIQNGGMQLPLVATSITE